MFNFSSNMKNGGNGVKGGWNNFMVKYFDGYSSGGIMRWLFYQFLRVRVMRCIVLSYFFLIIMIKILDYDGLFVQNMIIWKYIYN